MEVMSAAAVAQARFDALSAMGTDDPDECGAGFQFLDVIEALGSHFHEHQAAVLRWPWKLFCVKWRRMTVQLAKRDAERERDKQVRDAERQQDEATHDLQQAHRQHWGD